MFRECTTYPIMAVGFLVLLGKPEGLLHGRAPEEENMSYHCTDLDNEDSGWVAWEVANTYGEITCYQAPHIGARERRKSSFTQSCLVQPEI
jgi:hypothetical protein